MKFAKQAQKLTQLTCTRVFFNRNNLNQRFASRVNSPEHSQPPMVGRQLWPFPSTSNSFYRPSELTRMQFHEQQLEDSSHLSTIHNISDVSRAQSPISVASTASTASTSSLQSEEETPKGKTKKARSKSADWTENETQDLLEAWGLRYNQLRSASQKEKIKIWNEIYSPYKNAFPESQRTLQQIKKRQQNLEYEYKHLKQRTQKTREDAIKIIKDGFSYFDYFDEVMGHRDCANPTKMAVARSSIFTSTEQKGGSVESEDVPEESSPPA